jgi:hypothetical protein
VAFGKLVRLANRDVTTSNNSYKLAPVQDRTVTKVRPELALRSQGGRGRARSQGAGQRPAVPGGRIESNKRNTLYWAQYNLKQMGYNKFR